MNFKINSSPYCKFETLVSLPLRALRDILSKLWILNNRASLKDVFAILGIGMARSVCAAGQVSTYPVEPQDQTYDIFTVEGFKWAPWETHEKHFQNIWRDELRRRAFDAWNRIFSALCDIKCVTVNGNLPLATRWNGNVHVITLCEKMSSERNFVFRSGLFVSLNFMILGKNLLNQNSDRLLIENDVYKVRNFDTTVRASREWKGMSRNIFIIAI